MTGFGHASGENVGLWIENSDFFFLRKLRKNDVDSCLIKRWGIGRFCPSMTFRNLEALPVIWLILPLISSFRIPWKRYALYTLAEHQNPLLIISWFAFYEHTWFIKGTLFVISSMASFISRECSRYSMIFPWFWNMGWPIYIHLCSYSHIFPYDFTHSGKAYQPARTSPLGARLRCPEPTQGRTQSY